MIAAITEVFGELGTWIVDYMPTVAELFWDSSSSELTFLGVLAICGLGISIIFLLIGVIQNFLHFRG